jgi:hypothetical protein
MKTKPAFPNRRDFLRQAAAAGILLAMPASLLRGQAAADPAETPFLTGRSGKLPRAVPVYKILDIPRPASKKGSVQSAAFYKGKYYVFRAYSTVQEFADGKLAREYKIKKGELGHPNDASFHKDSLWICDTDDGPSIKRLDVATMEVVETININKPGWRAASVDIASGNILYSCQVEAKPVEERARFLVRKYDYKAQKTVQEWEFPLDQHYVQGCAISGRRLYVTTNNGGRDPKSKFIKLNLETSTVEDIIICDTFGESEGLQALQINGRLNLLSARGGKGAILLRLAIE